jgi:hypothetical protein
LRESRVNAAKEQFVFRFKPSYALLWRLKLSSTCALLAALCLGDYSGEFSELRKGDKI